MNEEELKNAMAHAMLDSIEKFQHEPSDLFIRAYARALLEMASTLPAAVQKYKRAIAERN